jgi:hypothetical protein
MEGAQCQSHISISVLDALEPSPEAKLLMRDYVDGKRDLAGGFQSGG